MSGNTVDNASGYRRVRKRLDACLYILFIWPCDECRPAAGDEKEDMDDERTWLGKSPLLGLKVEVEAIAKPFGWNAMAAVDYLDGRALDC